MTERDELIWQVQQAQQGDAEALEALVAMVQDRVYYHCKKMLRNEEDALDATQDVLISMVTNLGQLRETDAFFGWLGQITANRCKRMFARRETQEWLSEDENGDFVLDNLEETDIRAIPAEALDDDETQRMVLDIVDALPPEQRMSILLYYYDEMSVREIALAMDVSEGTVKSRLNYARRTIKRKVEAMEKQGVRLYGISPAVLVLLCLRKEAGTVHLASAQSARMIAAAESAGGGAAVASNLTAGGAVGAGASSSIGALGATVGAAGASGAGWLAAKIAAGVLTAVLVAEGAALTYRAVQNRQPTPSAIPAEVSAVAIKNENAPIEAPVLEGGQGSADAAMLAVLNTNPNYFYARLIDMDCDGNDELLVGTITHKVRYAKGHEGDEGYGIKYNEYSFSAYQWQDDQLTTISFDDAIYGLADECGVYQSVSSGEVYVGYIGYTDCVDWNLKGIVHFMRLVSRPTWEEPPYDSSYEYVVPPTPISQLQGSVNQVAPTLISEEESDVWWNDLTTIDEFEIYNDAQNVSQYAHTLTDTRLTLTMRTNQATVGE